MHLCLRCGLCCDGTLFHGVPLMPGEADAVRGRVRLSADESQLVQGCVALGADCKCGVYEARPQACRRFRCSVLSAMESGRASEDEAVAAIEEVLELRRRLSEAVGVTDQREAVRKLSAGEIELSADARELYEKFNRAIVMLQLTTS